jgi:hypothetical protein
LLTPPGFVTALIDHMAANPEAMVATPAMRQRSSSEVRALQAEEAPAGSAAPASSPPMTAARSISRRS